MEVRFLLPQHDHRGQGQDQHGECRQKLRQTAAAAAQKRRAQCAGHCGDGIGAAGFPPEPAGEASHEPQRARGQQYPAADGALVEGLLRIVIFVLYLWAVTRMDDVARMFAYHGAEHKTIFCYEKALPLTVENVRKQSRFHPRCGTSFLFNVIIISILVFSLVSFRMTLWDNFLVRVGLRLLLLPVVVSLTYELNRWVGRHEDLLIARILSAPGKWMQHLTTNEPDDSMIECAIRSLELVIPETQGSDAW